MTEAISKIDRSPEAADRRFAELSGDQSVIPTGSYCYRVTGALHVPEGETLPRLPIEPCPYWGAHPEKGTQDYGYCALLKTGDWEEGGTLLLWDQCKECGINDDMDEDDLESEDETSLTKGEPQ